MTPLRRRGYCRDCGTYGAVKKDGTMWAHKKFVGGGTYSVVHWDPCPGSGQPPRDDV